MIHDTTSQKLAGDGACSVYRCGCGCVHVHIGSTTVRVSAAMLEDLASVLSEARVRLQESQPVGNAGSFPC